MPISKKNLPLAITIGDPAGVGPEVIKKTFINNPRLGEDCVLIGPHQLLVEIEHELSLKSFKVGSDNFRVTPGKPSLDGAKIAFESMKLAAHGCNKRLYRGVVSGPVSKHWLQKVGFTFPGQTEFFADIWGGDPTMAFIGKELIVVLATWHIPLREVPMSLDGVCLEKAVTRAKDLALQLGVSNPRIGVCGINPHAGEGGIFGREEEDVLDPVLDILRESIPRLSRCLPGDTVFLRQRRGEFDVVVAAFHDQALSAVKTLEFDMAVNLTFGLPYIRTSPDHGTAFELAGQEMADYTSFTAALELARKLSN